MPPRAAVHCRSTATGWAPEAHALLEIRCVGRVQRAAVSEALGDARRCDRGPRAYRSHHRLVAALDGVGTGGPNCRDNLGDIPDRERAAAMHDTKRRSAVQGAEHDAERGSRLCLPSAVGALEAELEDCKGN